MTDGRLEVMFSLMGVTEEEWDNMTEEQRKEVAKVFVENLNEALKPIAEAIKTELIPTLNRIAKNLGDSMIEMGDQIEQAQINGEINMNELNRSEKKQVNGFVDKTRELKRKRQG